MDASIIKTYVHHTYFKYNIHIQNYLPYLYIP